jgi:hypothetical protein
MAGTLLPSILLAAMLAAGLSTPAGAQLTSSRKVTVLPFLSSPADSTLARQFYRDFLGSIRATRDNLMIPGESETLLSLEREPIGSLVTSTGSLSSFSARTGSAFVIGSAVRRLPDGGVEVGTMVYGREDESLRAVEMRRFDDAGAALSGVVALAGQIAHPRNLTPSDTPFFYSLLLPGAGQASLGRWDHALLSFGFVAGSVVYGMTTPDADPFSIDHGYYRERWDYAAQQYRYYLGLVEVSEDEFNTVFAEAQDHARRALAERRARDVRKRRATAMVAAAWVLNIADTLLLTRRRVDGRPFFALTNSITGRAEPLPDLQLGLRFTLPIHR